MGDPLLGVGAAVVAAVGLTVQSLAVRLASKTRSVQDIIAVMFSVNVLVFLPVAAFLGYPEYHVPRSALVAFAVAGVLGSLLARLCYFVGIARLGASRTEPVKALFPVVAVAVAVLFLGELVSIQLLAGIVLILGGSLAVVFEARESAITPTGRVFWMNMLFPLAAAFFLGVDPVFTKVGLAAGTDPVIGLTVRIVAGAIGFGLYLLFRSLRQGAVPSVRLNRWIILASLANTAYLLFYYAALARASVSVVTPVLGTSTLLVVGAAAIFLQDHERVTLKLAIAALVVVIGTVFVVQA